MHSVRPQTVRVAREMCIRKCHEMFSGYTSYLVSGYPHIYNVRILYYVCIHALLPALRVALGRDFETRLSNFMFIPFHLTDIINNDKHKNKNFNTVHERVYRHVVFVMVCTGRPRRLLCSLYYNTVQTMRGINRPRIHATGTRKRKCADRYIIIVHAIGILL